MCADILSIWPRPPRPDIGLRARAWMLPLRVDVPVLCSLGLPRALDLIMPRMALGAAADAGEEEGDVGASITTGGSRWTGDSDTIVTGSDGTQTPRDGDGDAEFGEVSDAWEGGKYTRPARKDAYRMQWVRGRTHTHAHTHTHTHTHSLSHTQASTFHLESHGTPVASYAIHQRACSARAPRMAQQRSHSPVPTVHMENRPWDCAADATWTAHSEWTLARGAPVFHAVD